MRQRMRERFDQQFADFTATLDPTRRKRWDSELAALLNARRAPLHKLVDGELQPVMVRVGASDGSHTEVLGGELKEGDLVIIGSARPEADK